MPGQSPFLPPGAPDCHLRSVMNRLAALLESAKPLAPADDTVATLLMGGLTEHADCVMEPGRRLEYHYAGWKPEDHLVEVNRLLARLETRLRHLKLQSMRRRQKGGEAA